jgi:hypothetical protein
MLAYPGYTRERIEAEMSYADTEAYMRAWKDTPPPGILLSKLLSSIGKKDGPQESEQSIANAVADLQAAGVVFKPGAL